VLQFPLNQDNPEEEEEEVMADPLCDMIMRKIAQAKDLYHRLLIVVAPSGGGKTIAINEVQKRTGAPTINVNLEMSRQMLDLSERQRSLQLPRLLQEIINSAEGELILLDNIELLFDSALKQDPVKLLQSVSRNKTVVVAWTGSTVDGSLLYAKPGHPEYQKYPIADYLVATTGEPA